MLHSPIPALDRVADRLEASLDAQAIADRLLAGLARIPLITDHPTVLHEAKRLASRVRGYVNLPNTAPGMLGRNGIQPAIEACIRAAHFHGFDWRTPEAMTDAVFAVASSDFDLAANAAQRALDGIKRAVAA